jgi:ElaA protein
MTLALHVAGAGDLDVSTLYALLRLRVDVFVVEQKCPYPELDGRDLEPTTRHLWLGPSRGEPVAYLRLLADASGAVRIGRGCTAVAGRGAGLSRRLVREALDLIGDGTPCVLDAQSYLVDFYQGFGFEPVGEEFVEDGIPHVPMRRG